MSDDKVLADLLQYHQYKNGYSLGRLAQETGISKATLQNWMDGTVKKPRSWQGLIAICATFNLSIEEASELLQVVGYPELPDLIPKIKQTASQQVLFWVASLETKNNIDERIRMALYEADYASALDTLKTKYTTKEILLVLKNRFVLRIEENVWLRIRALKECIQEEQLTSEDWLILVQHPIPELVAEILRLLSGNNIILNEETLHALFQNPALPRQIGLGEVVVQFIQQGASYTSEIFLPLVNSPAWQIRHDCIKSTIQLDDQDSLKIIQAFIKTTTYWVSRKITVKYLRRRIESNSLSPTEFEIAEQILAQIINDGKTSDTSGVKELAIEIMNMLKAFSFD